ncbi:hypothetical protein [Lonsdalea iberica]|uniref:hypothetical protein n=1 Tax=Lonsdalea iberica TaxID=1082703 RepID=UPI000C1BF722|nr:hypothetical protein [Lonsdalea iberica]
MMKKTFLRSSLAMGIMLLCGLAQAASFTAGAGRADITIPDDIYPIDGFVGQHDPLATRVILLDDGTTRLGIVVVDQTSLSNESIANMKAALQQVAQVAPERTIVSASHGFSAPHILPHEHTSPDVQAQSTRMQQAMVTAVRSAALSAVNAMTAARVGYGEGVSRVNVNRDVPTPFGWWLGANEKGNTDPVLSVLRIDTAQGAPLAAMINYAVQSSVMDGSTLKAGGKLITPDLAGVATRYVEQHGGEPVAAFLVGAAGDQAPRRQANRHVVNRDGSVTRVDSHEEGVTLLDQLGTELGRAAADVSGGIHATASPTLALERKSVTVTSQTNSPGNAPKGPVTTYTYTPGRPVALPVVLIRIGDIALVGVQPELAAQIGERIKAESPFAHTLVLTMVDGAAKYLPDDDSYNRFTYEARNSGFAQGSADKLVDAVRGWLNDLHRAAPSP